MRPSLRAGNLDHRVRILFSAHADQRLEQRTDLDHDSAAREIRDLIKTGRVHWRARCYEAATVGRDRVYLLAYCRKPRRLIVITILNEGSLTSRAA